MQYVRIVCLTKNLTIMNVYNFKKIEKCYVCGNIDRNISKFIDSITSNLKNFKKEEHPKEIERQERLNKRTINAQQERHGIFGRLGDNGARPISYNEFKKKMSSKHDSSYNDSVIIVSGNCGIGLKDKGYYERTFSKLDKILGDNNCYLLFVRGNNDDPSYFENRTIDFEHVKTIPDYSVVAMKTYNCLCIGGSVSIDKEWKKSQENTIGRKMYWENEAPIFDEKAIDEILSEFKIACVITSTSPSFSYPGTNAFKKSKWFISDKSRIKDFSDERKTLDKIYEKILENDTKPFIWFYGRFKLNNENMVNDIVFKSLSKQNIVQFNELLSKYFSLDTSKKIGDNTHSLDGIDMDSKQPTVGFALPDDPFNNEEEEMEEDGGRDLTIEMPQREPVEVVGNFGDATNVAYNLGGAYTVQAVTDRLAAIDAATVEAYRRAETPREINFNMDYFNVARP